MVFMHENIESTNPAKNYVRIGTVEISGDAEIKEKVEKANSAKLAWKELGVTARVKLLLRVYRAFSKRKREFASMITKETGKPIKESECEMHESLELYFKWFLENAEKALEDKVVFKDGKEIHQIIFEPLGTTAVITPWNFPFEMFVWGVIPNLIAGNTVVFKISEECPLAGKLIEEVMLSQKLPEGVFSEIYGAGDVGEKLASGSIDCIWFTGSSMVGKKLYQIAADKFIKAVLEMGGSNAGIVFEDADLDGIIGKIYSKRFDNCGQTCDAIKRLIVHETIFNKVVEKLKKEIEGKIVGDPENPETNVGSLVAKRQLALLESQVEDAIANGAKIVVGGRRPETLEGAFYLPTILTGVSTSMRVWREEVFGPVLLVIPFDTEEQAIQLANDSEYGLGAVVFTKDKKRAKKIAARLAVGTVEINSGSHWQPCSPFGGYKNSGLGREHGFLGFQELCQVKLIAESLEAPNRK